MKVAILCYVPPPEINGKQFYSDVFLKNLANNPPDAELILYSDHPWPGVVPLKAAVDSVIPHDHKFTLPNGSRNTFALNNLLFFTGLKIAREHGVTHMLYLESDCRVKGKGWDQKLFDEFFSHPVPAICGGTPVVFNASNAGAEALARWLDFANKNTRRNFPIKTILPVPPGIYGFKGAAEADGSCVFPNGAGGIYSVDWLCEFFPDAVADPSVVQEHPQYRASHPFGRAGRLAAMPAPLPVQVSGSVYAWDFEIGQQIWKRFESESYDLVANLPSLYSGFGDVITSEQERLDMLRNGSCVCVHQVKSGATV